MKPPSVTNVYSQFRLPTVSFHISSEFTTTAASATTTHDPRILSPAIQTMGNNFLERSSFPFPTLSPDHPFDEQPVQLEAEANVIIHYISNIKHFIVLTLYQNSPSESESTDQAQSQLQNQNWELRGIITKLRNENSSIVLENAMLRRELHTLRSEMQEVVDTLGEYSKEWAGNEVRYAIRERMSRATGTFIII